MQNKTAVQFRKNRKVTHTYQRLKYCKSCGSYSVLFDNQCKKCRAQNSYVSVEHYAGTLNTRMKQTEIFTFISIICASVVLAQDLMQLSIALGGGLCLVAIYALLLKRYKPYYEAYRLQKLFITQTPQIRAGLEFEVQEAVEDIRANNYKSAYEKLREIGVFLTNEPIKVRKVMCLNTFIIRKDMELELESVIPSYFDKDFITYLFEVSKVNKQLIRQDVLEYVAIHREQIELLGNGKEVMTNVVGAALRMKHYVELYQSIIIDYIDLLPKERLLRLCKMLAASPDSELGGLTIRCKETARIRYAFDPDFQGIW